MPVNLTLIIVGIVVILGVIGGAYYLQKSSVTPPTTQSSTVQTLSTALSSVSTAATTAPTTVPTTVAVYGAACIPAPGYLCQNVTLKSSQISFTFGQNAGYTEYNIQMACAATVNTNGQPNAPFYPETPSSLVTGNNTKISGLTCAGASATVNSTFNGYLFINFTPHSGAPSSSNPPNIVKFATVSVKSS